MSEEKKLSLAAISVLTARALLQVRSVRRKLMLYNVVVVLGLCLIGSWPLSGWLEGSIWRMGVFWGGVMVLTIFMMLLALYDMLSIMKEFKDQKRELE